MEERPIRPTNPSTMQTIEITLTPEQYNDGELLKQAVSRQSGIAESDIGHVEVVRRSLDSRRGIHYHVTRLFYNFVNATTIVANEAREVPAERAVARLKGARRFLEGTTISQPGSGLAPFETTPMVPFW